jgi:hypothetical protein
MIKIKRFEDLKSLESTEIYTLLRNFEFCTGEDFLDYNEDYINKANLAFYLLGNGIISKSQFNICIDTNILRSGDLNELFEEFEIIDIYRLKILADISVNFDTLLKRLFGTYKIYELDFEITQDLIEKIKPELKILY